MGVKYLINPVKDMIRDIGRFEIITIIILPRTRGMCAILIDTRMQSYPLRVSSDLIATKRKYILIISGARDATIKKTANALPRHVDVIGM